MKKTNQFKRQIMGVTWFFVALFIVMAGYIVVYALVNEQEMAENTFNDIQIILMEQNTRGTIYASDGEVLAQTKTDANGSESRIYPYENTFAHAVGFATHGRMGIEAIANYYLIQSSISLSERAGNATNGVKNPGDSIHATLRVDLQEIAHTALAGYRGAVIVTEPQTGKILAMVSRPDFAPGQIAAIWSGLLADTESSVLLNRVTQGLYPPGSTFKIMTALQYLRENNLDIESYHFNCRGYFSAFGERINCFAGIAHGNEDFSFSFAKSCNSSFANIGISLDQDQFAITLNELMFGVGQPSPLVYNRSSVELNDETTDAELLQIMIGQGRTLVTPQHLHMITSAIANDGVLAEPYLLEEVRNVNGEIVRSFGNNDTLRLMSISEAESMRQLMAEVVLMGTATRLRNSSYTAAGKTGSAEFGAAKGESHAWFTGFAPVENPQIAVTIIIEGAGTGGDYAVPIAARLFEQYFK
ncbi:MAG: penicillin-binding protein 2 [Lachnospiraceae bacterium]|jgi:peptidoglycan glycosyltransferase|nr:penicillin-binding protein 2 [Lachnospiraceae bacterium]